MVIKKWKSTDLIERIENEILDSVEVKKKLILQKQIILKIAHECVKSISQGNKIILCGNGGSAADSQHIVAELIGIFSHKIKRKALPAIALTTNTSIITAIANDISFNKIFSRQIEGICKKNDVVIGISTSGKSPNVIEAIKLAKKMKAKTVALTGKDKNSLSKIADISLNVPSKNTQRIQECHILIGHILCMLIENKLK